ncbi:Putative Na(+)/H(+) antiporter [Mycobacteroides abscessus]|nr:Putative Na(+)/H(+) antiporter [Mycobacteroides abscessus]
MSLHQLYLDLLIGGLVLLASIVGTRVATRIGFPSLLFFLLVGVVLGEDGLGLEFDNVELARNVCTAALAFDQQDLVAVVDQFACDGAAHLARAGDRDPHLLFHHPAIVPY